MHVPNPDSVFDGYIVLFKKTAFGSTPVGGAETSMRFMAEALTQTDCKPIYLVVGINKKESATEPESINGVKLYHYYTAQYPLFERIGWKFRVIGLVLSREQVISMFLLRRLLQSLLARHDIGIIYTSYDREILLPLLKFKRTTKSTVKIVMRMAGCVMMRCESSAVKSMSLCAR